MGCSIGVNRDDLLLALIGHGFGVWTGSGWVGELELVSYALVLMVYKKRLVCIAFEYKALISRPRR